MAPHRRCTAAASSHCSLTLLVDAPSASIRHCTLNIAKYAYVHCHAGTEAQHVHWSTLIELAWLLVRHSVNGGCNYYAHIANRLGRMHAVAAATCVHAPPTQACKLLRAHICMHVQGCTQIYSWSLQAAGATGKQIAAHQCTAVPRVHSQLRRELQRGVVQHLNGAWPCACPLQ